jgi:hypothetical protein
MRTLFLALMIALLPLRGWVGDVMALELDTAPAKAHHYVSVAAQTALQEGSEVHTVAGHHGHAMPVASNEDACDDQLHGAEGHCTLCQICHSVALAPVLPLLPAAVLPLAAPAAAQPLYTSAERALGDKPPIS